MRIVTNEEMRNLDEKAIEEIGYSGLVLMENAGLEAARLVSKTAETLQLHKFSKPSEILVICGKGRNGGDGFVVARHLLIRGHRVHAFLMHEVAQLAEETKANMRIFENLRGKVSIASHVSVLENYFQSTSGPYVIVDALLGTGLDREIEGHLFDVIELLNRQNAEIIALDIPSGVQGETGRLAGTSVQANQTIAFGFPRLGHFLAPGAARRGVLHNVDLGFPRSWNREGSLRLMRFESVARLIAKRDQFGHKNTFGHCLMVGGSQGRLGAISMAAQSCLRMGTGLVTVASWKDSFPQLEMKLPSEIMTYQIEDTNSAHFNLHQFAAAVVGPGWGTRKEGATLLKLLLENDKLGLVIDADGLNLFAEHRFEETSLRRRTPCVLTPHPGEMARLLGVEKNDVTADPLNSVRRAVELTGAVVVLKGATTLIHSPEGTTYVLYLPNDGMAKAGSGDVLAGMIGGLLTQGMPPLEAARLGAGLHALSGRLAAQKIGERAMTATVVTDFIEEAFRELVKLGEQKEFFHESVVTLTSR